MIDSRQLAALNVTRRCKLLLACYTQPSLAYTRRHRETSARTGSAASTDPSDAHAYFKLAFYPRRPGSRITIQITASLDCAIKLPFELTRPARAYDPARDHPSAPKKIETLRTSLVDREGIYLTSGSLVK